MPCGWRPGSRPFSLRPDPRIATVEAWNLDGAFAGAETAGAHSAFQQRRFDVLGAHRDVLDGLGAAASASAATYETTDAGGAVRFEELR